MDQSFELNAEEEKHWDDNTYYDQATVVALLTRYIREEYYRLSVPARIQIQKRLGIAVEPANSSQFQELLLSHLEQLVRDGLLCLDEVYVGEMVKYREITNLFIEFASSMMATSDKAIKIDNEQLGLLFASVENL